MHAEQTDQAPVTEAKPSAVAAVVTSDAGKGAVAGATGGGPTDAAAGATMLSALQDVLQQLVALVQSLTSMLSGAPAGGAVAGSNGGVAGGGGVISPEPVQQSTPVKGDDDDNDEDSGSPKQHGNVPPVSQGVPGGGPIEPPTGVAGANGDMIPPGLIDNPGGVKPHTVPAAPPKPRVKHIYTGMAAQYARWSTEVVSDNSKIKAANDGKAHYTEKLAADQKKLAEMQARYDSLDIAQRDVSQAKSLHSNIVTLQKEIETDKSQLALQDTLKAEAQAKLVKDQAEVDKVYNY